MATATRLARVRHPGVGLPFGHQLGILVFTGEYGTGMILASASVVPRRLMLLLWQAGGHARIWFGDPRVVRITVGAACGLALGAIIRNTAGSISTFVGIFLVLPVLPKNEAGFARFLPSNAGGALWGRGAVGGAVVA